MQRSGTKGRGFTCGVKKNGSKHVKGDMRLKFAQFSPIQEFKAAQHLVALSTLGFKGRCTPAVHILKDEQDSRVVMFTCPTLGVFGIDPYR